MPNLLHACTGARDRLDRLAETIRDGRAGHQEMQEMVKISINLMEAYARTRLEGDLAAVRELMDEDPEADLSEVIWEVADGSRADHYPDALAYLVGLPWNPAVERLDRLQGAHPGTVSEAVTTIAHLLYEACLEERAETGRLPA